MGTRVHPWQIHVDVWQTQYDIVTILVTSDALSLWHMDPLVNIKQRVAKTHFILLHSHHKRDGHFAALTYSLKISYGDTSEFPST